VIERRVRRRAMLLGPLAIVVLGTLVWAFAGIPDFGGYAGVYGHVLTHIGVAQRHADNIVTAVVFDYRGVDTMGEDFILFGAAMGAALLLRGSREMEEQRPRDIVLHDLTRVSTMLLLPVVMLLALWLVTFGYITPGGGFQGGVVIAGGLLMLWVGGSYRDYRAATPTAVVEGVGAFGAFGYVAIGLATLGVSGYFLDNVMPLGSTGSLTSSGTISLLNWCSALEVAGANLLLYQEFLKQYVGTLPGEAKD
jgi:multicomponent Na+:H+ antiporter subunit B